MTGTTTILFTGGSMVSPFGVAVSANGDVWMADPGSDSIIRDSLVTPGQSVVTSSGFLVEPQGIAVEPSGNLVVADLDAAGGTGAVIRVDPDTGIQTIVSSGGAFFNPTGITVAGNGDIFVIDDGADQVIRVDPVSGAQTVLPLSASFVNPTGIAIEEDGDILVADFNWTDGNGAVVRVHPVTGIMTVVSSGGSFKSPFGVTVVPPAPGCSSSVTTLSGLGQEVDALTTSTQTKNALKSILANVQQALNSGNNETARSRMDNFISTAVNRSNMQNTNSHRIALEEANHLICGAANVLVGIPLP